MRRANSILVCLTSMLLLGNFIFLLASMPITYFSTFTQAQITKMISRNCVRLGRECRYTTNAGSGSTRCQPRALVVSASTKQAVMAMILPQTFTFYYCDPKLRGTSSAAISIVQQAGEISMARPMARSILLTAAHIGGPK